MHFDAMAWHQSLYCALIANLFEKGEEADDKRRTKGMIKQLAWAGAVCQVLLLDNINISCAVRVPNCLVKHVSLFFSFDVIYNLMLAFVSVVVDALLHPQVHHHIP